MANDVTNTASFGQLPAALRGAKVEDNLGQGIQSGFPVVAFKGKIWRIRHRGEEQIMRRPDDGTPVAALNVIIVHAPPHLSKTFYKEGFQEDSRAAPDCYSLNAVRPEPNVPDMQNPTCADCPHNQWGSRVTPAGKKGKACQDNKRLAVMLAGTDANNGAKFLEKAMDFYGGPMLLRVPAASLSDLGTYAKKMNHQGYPTSAVVTRMSFDEAQAYPKFIFEPLRALTDEEYELVVKMREDGSVERILNTPVEIEQKEEAPASPFLQGGPQKAPAKAAQSVAAAAPVAGSGDMGRRDNGVADADPAFGSAPIGGGDVAGNEPETAPVTAKARQGKPAQTKAAPKVEAAVDIKKDEAEDAEFTEAPKTGVDEFDSILEGMLPK